MSFSTKIQAYTSTRWLAALLLAVIAYSFIKVGVEAGDTIKFLIGGVLIAVGIGLVARVKWGIHAASLALLIMATNSLLQLDFKHLDVWQLGRIAATFWFAHYLWKNPEERWLGGDELLLTMKECEEVSLISLVQLRSQPQDLSPQRLAEIFSTAWGLKITNDKDSEGDGFISGERPPFHIFINRPRLSMFIYHCTNVPYLDSPEETAAQAPNLRIADVIRSHQACSSVDFVRNSNPQMSEGDAYKYIGKAIAALADEGTLAVIAPEQNYFNLWSPKLKELLCGSDPLSIFKEEVKAPIYGVKDGDSIESAVAEARRRWPEFVSAFHEKKSDDTLYLVKAPFSSEYGEVEHMWLQVLDIESDYIHGHLINDPFFNKKLTKGSLVKVAAAEISDWVCPDEAGSAKGNFTTHIVRG